MYKKTQTEAVIRIDDGACIPADPRNQDYQAYLAWVAAGNSALPADAAPPIPLKQQAQTALDSADIAMLRCVENGVSVPAAWATYRKALRAILNGTDTTSTALPTRPAYPAGT